MVNEVVFNFIDFDEIVDALPKLRARFPNVCVSLFQTPQNLNNNNIIIKLLSISCSDNGNDNGNGIKSCNDNNDNDYNNDNNNINNNNNKHSLTPYYYRLMYL